MPSLALVAALVLQQQALPLPRSTGPMPTVAAVASDTGALRHPNGRVPPVAAAVRATVGAPRIDGRLDDAVWTLAQPVTQFTQQSPKDGDPATERTEVRIAYDDEAIYIGARMYDSDPAAIVARLGRRDADTQADLFEVDFDSYHDHRTSFQFIVNPLGVKRDQVATNDFSGGDAGWDPVWDAAAQRDSLGWTAEFRIPLSQLRFPNAPAQVWGVNFLRYLQRKAESDVWAYSSQTEQGYASFFGHLLDLAHLPQPRRLEVLPYVAGIEDRSDPGAAGNPFNDGSRETARVGLDLKYGLTSDLTLNATVNPDFGQVEADPAEVNLTAYETYFSEQRPFFVEGAGIFSGISPGGIQVNGPHFLYSRRIGRSPQASAGFRGDSAFTDEPTSTTILGAAKLSGRTAGGWSLGLLEAVTDRAFARVDSAGIRFRDAVEPLTNYVAVRAKREMGSGSTTLGFTGTAVNRRIDDPRLAFLHTGAYAGGVDFGHRLSRNRYSLFAAFGYSYVRGDTLAIQEAQTSSARYYQRPDAGYVSYDPARTALAGWNAALGFSKDEGSLNYAIGVNATSPGFEINDLGYQPRADRATLDAIAQQRWTRPGRVFRNAQVSAMSSLGWNFGGDRTDTYLSASAYGQLLNYWSGSLGFSRSFRVVNDGLLRGGPAGISPASWSAHSSVSSDYRKRLQGYVSFSYTRNEIGGWSTSYYASLAVRPSPTISISVGPSYSVGLSSQQYLTAVADPAAVATFGQRYLFAEVLQHSLDLTTRLDVTFTPRLSLQLYAQPFVATGAYRRFRELAAPRTTDYLIYGETTGSSLTPVTNPDGSVAAYLLDPDGAGPRSAVQIANPNFSARSLRGNAVVRWEYRPGSTLFFVWTTACSAYSPGAQFDAAGDMGRLCQGRADNVFAVKANYWLSL